MKHLKFRDIMKKIYASSAILLIFSLVVEPFVFQAYVTRAEAVGIKVSDLYNTITGTTTSTLLADTVTTTITSQGLAALYNITDNGWTENYPGCIGVANDIKNGLTAGTAACANPSPPTACRTLPTGGQACNADLPPAPVTGIDANCASVDVQANQANIDYCTQYANDPTCVVTGSTCLTTDAAGNCVSTNKTYTCGTGQITTTCEKKAAVSNTCFVSHNYSVVDTPYYPPVTTYGPLPCGAKPTVISGDSNEYCCTGTSNSFGCTATLKKNATGPATCKGINQYFTSCDLGVTLNVGPVTSYTPAVAATHTLTDNGFVDGSPQCSTMADSIIAGSITGSVTCTQGPALGTTSIDLGTGIVQASEMTSPFAGISSLCQEVTVTNESAAAINTCQPLESNPACSFVSSQTMPDGRVVFTYDCNVGGVVDTTPATPGTTVCPGAIDCSDGSCVNMDAYATANDKFGEVMAQLNIAQQMQSEGNCDPVTGTCLVFDGTSGACNDYASVGKNCCQEAADAVPAPDMGQYLSVLSKLTQLNYAIGSLAGTTPVVGAWQAMGSPGAATWDAVTSTFTEAWNSVVGESSSAAISTTGEQGLMSAAGQWLIDKAAEYTAQVFGQAVADQLFVQSATTGLLEINPAITGTASFLMTAYLTYQVVMLLIDIIFACNDTEFEYAYKKKLSACHIIDNRCTSSNVFGCAERQERGCCFSSPLGRIIQEQARPQLGRPWLTPNTITDPYTGLFVAGAGTPDCGGLTTAELQNLDWSKIDLSEWINMLDTNGLMPDPSTVTMDSLTGAGSTFDTYTQDPYSARYDPYGQPRQNTAQRTQERLNGQGTSVDQLRIQLQNSMW